MTASGHVTLNSLSRLSGGKPFPTKFPNFLKSLSRLSGGKHNSFTETGIADSLSRLSGGKRNENEYRDS